MCLVGWHIRFRFVRSAARELMSFALGTYTKGMLDNLSLNVDNVVIGRVLGVTPLGFYDKAFSAVQRVFKRLTVIGPSVSFRALAIMQDEPERFHRAFNKIIVASTFVSYGVFAVLGTMGGRLIVVLFGEPWRPSILPFQLLCIAGALKISNVWHGAGAAANARGWIWSNVWRQAVQTICIVVGVYVGARWGVNGATFAVLVATVIMFFLTLSLLQASVQLGWRDLMRPHVPGLWLAGCLIVLVWGVGALLGSTRWICRTRPSWVCNRRSRRCSRSRSSGWSPFDSVRVVVQEIAGDVSPRVARLLVGDMPPEPEADKTKGGARPTRIKEGVVQEGPGAGAGSDDSLKKKGAESLSDPIPEVQKF